MPIPFAGMGGCCSRRGKKPLFLFPCIMKQLYLFNTSQLLNECIGTDFTNSSRNASSLQGEHFHRGRFEGCEIRSLEHCEAKGVFYRRKNARRLLMRLADLPSHARARRFLGASSRSPKPLCSPETDRAQRGIRATSVAVASLKT